MQLLFERSMDAVRSIFDLYTLEIRYQHVRCRTKNLIVIILVKDRLI